MSEIVSLSENPKLLIYTPGFFETSVGRSTNGTHLENFVGQKDYFYLVSQRVGSSKGFTMRQEGRRLHR